MSPEKRQRGPRRIISIEIHSKRLDFIDGALAEEGCPWESRSDFIDDCVEFYLKAVFQRALDLVEGNETDEENTLQSTNDNEEN